MTDVLLAGGAGVPGELVCGPGSRLALGPVLQLWLFALGNALPAEPCAEVAQKRSAALAEERRKREEAAEKAAASPTP